MDYIRETWTRQRAALEELMLGGGMIAERQEEESSTVSRRAAEAEMAAVRRAASMLEQVAADMAARYAMVEREESVRLLAEAFAGAEEAAKKSTVKELAAQVPRGSQQVAESGFPTAEIVAAGEWMPWETRETAWEPRRISRVIQRDARRYDGGFALY